MLLLGYGYKRNNLARLGGYPAHQNVADMSDFFYFDFVFIWLRRGVGGGRGGGWRSYWDLSFWSQVGWTKINVKTLQPVW